MPAGQIKRYVSYLYEVWKKCLGINEKSNLENESSLF